MRKRLHTGVLAISLVSFAGCSNLPGNDEQQGAVIGGASGAAIGAAVTENRALGAIIGGAVGAAGGYVVGKNSDKIFGDDSEEVKEAAREAQEEPATAAEARAATTADVNSDGYVTLDELVAMEQAGLTDDEIIDRLEATDQVFDLTPEQSRYLLDKGVSQDVINHLPSLNEHKAPVAVPDDNVITQPRPTI